MHYGNPRHARRYRNIISGKKYSSRTLAALNAKASWEKCSTGAFLTHLLTADRKLWNHWRLAVNSAGIDWSAGQNTDPDWDSYHLEQAALSIARQTLHQVTLHDLADPINYPQELLRLIITALWIARNDRKPITEIIINGKDKNVSKQRPY